MLTDILINVNEPIHNCDLVSYYVVVDGMAKEIPLAAIVCKTPHLEETFEGQISLLLQNLFLNLSYYSELKQFCIRD